MGPHPWGIRVLAHAWLLAVWVLNPGWVLYCLSRSLPGTQTYVRTHTHTHTHTHTQSACADLDPPLLRAQMETEAREVVRHLVPLSPSQVTLAVPLKKS